MTISPRTESAEKAIAGEVIPADVMEAAWACVDQYTDPDIVPAIARAIMAATEAESERCARICEEDNVNWQSSWRQTNAGIHYARLIRTPTKGAHHE